MSAPAGSGTRPESRRILGMRVDATSEDDAAERIAAWARAGESRAVCVANVHMVMEAYDDPSFCELVNAADIVTPDGMPLVWGLRAMLVSGATRVYGPDLTPAVCARAARDGIPVGFYGGAPETLERCVANLRARFPALRVAFASSPPFRPLSEEEDTAIVRAIEASGARILFVGLGCPRQERWIAAHRGRIPAVMLGVGAAFDFLAGMKPQAPRWMMRLGLEWLFRLASEPRRLWRRYAVHNPRFVLLFARQLLRRRGREGRPEEALQSARRGDEN